METICYIMIIIGAAELANVVMKIICWLDR